MNDQAWTRYEEFVKRIMQEQNIAGASIAAWQNGNTIYSKAFGMANIAEQKPVDTDTVFGCASVSKSFTALAITQLADAGKLSVDDPVVQHLPEFRLRGLEDIQSVRLSHLLSHTTGLPPMGRRPNFTDFEQHLEYLATADYTLLGKPGEHLSYCNDTFLLLGAVIERASGMGYREYMKSEILDRIGMPRTTMDINEVAAMGNFTELYVKNPETKTLESKPWVELGMYEVGGGVRSNVNALLRYGQVYLSGGKIDGRRIVSEAGLRRMYTPVHQISLSSHYAFALQVTPGYHGVTLVEHGGGQPGVSSNFGFVPEKNLTVMVLTNVTNVPANSLWLGAVNTALGLSVEEPKTRFPSVAHDPRFVRLCTGRYKTAEGADLRIEAVGDGLSLETEGQKYDLVPTIDDTFTYFSAGQIRTIKFYAESGKPAWAAKIGLRMAQRADD